MIKIILAHELLEKALNKNLLARHLDVFGRTIIRWSQAIDRHGSLEAFLEYYHQAKKGDRQKRKIDPILKCHTEKVFSFLIPQHQSRIL